MILIDPKNALTIALMQAAASKAANFNSSVIDLSGFVGNVAIILNAGAHTVGDNDSTLDIRLMQSAEANGANAVNSGLAFTQLTHAGGASFQVLDVDTRTLASGQIYLKAVAVIAGTNSPAFPVSMSVIGQKRDI